MELGGDCETNLLLVILPHLQRKHGQEVKNPHLKRRHGQKGNKYPHQLPILDNLPHHLAALLLLHLQGASLRQVGHRYLTAACHLKHSLSEQYKEPKEYTGTTIS